jgi:ferredoxin-NADP reductase
MVKESEDVYICGGRDMVQDVVGLLLKAGISKENIYYERYN